MGRHGRILFVLVGLAKPLGLHQSVLVIMGLELSYIHILRFYEASFIIVQRLLNMRGILRLNHVHKLIVAARECLF